MKQKLLKTLLLLCALVVGGVSSVWADEVTFTFGKTNRDVNSTSAVTKSGVTVTVTQNGAANAPNFSSDASDVRFQDGNKMTISSTNNITQVVISYTTAAYAEKITQSSFNVGTYSYTSNQTTGTWTGSTNSLEIVNGGGSQSRISQIVVTATTAASGQVTTTTISPSITNTNVFVGTAAGSLSASVTYGSPSSNVPDASVTWSSSDESVATITSAGVVTLVAAGSTTITASYAGETGVYESSSDTYILNVINEDPSLETIWSENFSTYKADDVPREGTYSYVCVDGNAATKIYADAAAGGTSPELLINKKGTTTNGSFSATIPLTGGDGYAGTMLLKFKNNNTISISAKDNNDVTIKSSTSITANTTTGNAVEISGITAEMTSITIEWSNGSSSNVRIDDIELKAKPAPAAPTFDVASCTFDEAFDIHLSTTAEGAAIYYTTDGTTPTSSSTLYSTKISIPASTTTIKAISVKDGLASMVSSVTYTYDERETPTFSLSSTKVDLYVNVAGSITLTSNHNGTITATSSDDTHLPISYNSGTKVCTFTPTQAGEYTITFSATSSAEYKDAEAIATVTVTKKPTTMVMETAFNDGKDLRTASAGLIEGTVKYNDAALSPQPTINYTSSNTSVATVNSDGEVTFVKAGSTTLKAAYDGNDEYAACEVTYVLDLIDTTPQDIEVSITLNNSFFGKTGTISGNTLDEVSATKNNIDVEILRNGGSLYLNNTSTRLYPKSLLTFEAPAGYFISQIVLMNSEDATDADLQGDTGSFSAGTWTGDASSVQFSAGKSFTSSYKTITTAIVTLAPRVTVSSAGYATYASDHNLNFTGKSIKAYIATTKGDGTGVEFTQVLRVPAGTGMLLYKDGGTTESIPVFDGTGADVTTGNVFVRGEGETVATDDGTNYNYILNNGASGLGFYRANDKMVATNRAYISILKSESASVKGFIALPGSEETAVEAVKADAENGVIFNLAGQRVSKLQRGINIINGKKVVVK